MTKKTVHLGPNKDASHELHDRCLYTQILQSGVKFVRQKKTPTTDLVGLKFNTLGGSRYKFLQEYVSTC